MSIAVSRPESAGAIIRSAGSRRSSWSGRCCCTGRRRGAARRFTSNARTSGRVGAPAGAIEPNSARPSAPSWKSCAATRAICGRRSPGSGAGRSGASRFWVHLTSAKFALGCSLGCNGLLLALLIAGAHYAEPLVWAPAGDASFDTFVLWQAAEGRMLLANWMAVSFGAVAMPLFYSRAAGAIARTARRPDPGLAGIRRRRSGPVDRSAAGRGRNCRGGAPWRPMTRSSNGLGLPSWAFHRSPRSRRSRTPTRR